VRAAVSATYGNDRNPEIKTKAKKALIFIESRYMQALFAGILTQKFSLSRTPSIINGRVPAKARH
jgi:hypothetical protein